MLRNPLSPAKANRHFRPGRILHVKANVEMHTGLSRGRCILVPRADCRFVHLFFIPASPSIIFSHFSKLYSQATLKSAFMHLILPKQQIHTGLMLEKCMDNDALLFHKENVQQRTLQGITTQEAI